MSPAPISPYGVAKLTGEFYARAFYHSFGLETVSLRFFNVFGPRQDPDSNYAAAIPKFIKLMLNGERPPVYGDGTQSRDFTYIDNVVHGMLLACAASDAAGEVINLASGGQVVINDLVEKLNASVSDRFAPCLRPASARRYLALARRHRQSARPVGLRAPRRIRRGFAPDS